jgi:predicted GIY-YIG superfamily endonuclease
MKTGIYSMTCVPTGQKYIGTAIDWEKRIAQHISKLKRCKHKNRKLQLAWNERGAAAFEFKLVEECEINRLLEREQHWVTQTSSDTTGFNGAWLGSNGFLTHGQTYTRAFKSWDAMKQRCINPNNNSYSRYGALGVKVCDRWLESFENFYADMGDRPYGMTLDRYPDKHGNYEPGNCRWATPAQQQRNLRSNIYMTFQGVTKLAVDWAREANIPVGILRRRINNGVTGPALFAPTYKSFAGVKDADGLLPKRYRQPKEQKLFEAFGKAQTLAAWSAELGVSISTLNQRLGKYKMPPEKALAVGQLKRGKTGPRQGHKMITAFGKTQSLTSWARECKLPVSTLKNRIYRSGMKPEDALTRG